MAAGSTDRGLSRPGWLQRLLPARTAEADAESRLVAGWRVIARKELADHLTSARFIVLLIIIGIAAAVPLYFASGRIRDLAPQASGTPAVFLALFTLGPEQFGFLRADTFVGLFAPLLGIAFGFDAVNVERSEGTLPRLVSQPIHRDDVINGKFAAGLTVIAIALVAMVLLVAGFGILRLGIVPDISEVLRIIAWLGVTLIYAGFWLAFAMLLSVLFRRAATSALIGFGLWAGVVLIGSIFLLDVIAGLIAPMPAGPPATEQQLNDQIRAAQTQNLIRRMSPHTLFSEAATVLLIPNDPVSAGSFTPATIDEVVQATDDRRIPSRLSIEQSLLLVWPQVVGLVALTTVVFAAAYVVFMRQEVRA